MQFLPYGRQTIDEDDIEAVTEALRGDFLTTGPKVFEFEKALCEATGAKEAVVCSNGTTALHLAALALGLKEADAVIVPSLTFLATANAARYCSADVVFADVDPESGMMGVDQAQEALKKSKIKPKILFGVHLGGHACDLEGLASFAKKNGMKFIADACHGLGGSYKGKAIGSCEFEALSTFSFHPVKPIATGEGGAVMTHDEEWAQAMRILRSHGMQRREDIDPWFYEMRDLGFNYRLADVQCALGLSQLKKLPGFVAQREKLAALYDELLKPYAPAVKTPVRQKDSKSAWHLYSVRIDFAGLKIKRGEVMDRLREQGIGTQVHYIPVHTQPYYRKLYGAQDLPGAKAYYDATLSLPLFPAMNEGDVKRVAEALRDVLKL